MKKRAATTLRHAVTAVMLLGFALALVEFWLRGRAIPSVSVVASQASSEDQSLLVPSSVFHHELRRLTKVSHLSSAGATAVRIRTNSLGCRGEELAMPAPEGTFRILFLGDDSVCGLSVPENETITARLRQFLSKSISTELEIINAGVPGYCPLLNTVRYQQDLFRLKPDLVILHVDMTDIADDCAYRSLIQSEGSNVVCSHASLRLPTKPDNAVLHFVKQSATATWLVSMTRQHGPDFLSLSESRAACPVGLNWISDNPPDLRLQIRHALDPIRDLYDSVTADGGQLLVTTSPVLWQIAPAEVAPGLSRRLGIKGATPYETTFPFEVIEKFCERSEIPFLNTADSFRGDNAVKLFSRDAPVLSRMGMALYAREIARYLIDNPPEQWTPLE